MLVPVTSLCVRRSANRSSWDTSLHCTVAAGGGAQSVLTMRVMQKIVQHLAGAGNNFFHTLDISCNKLAVSCCSLYTVLLLPAPQSAIIDHHMLSRRDLQPTIAILGLCLDS